MPSRTSGPKVSARAATDSSCRGTNTSPRTDPLRHLEGQCKLDRGRWKLESQVEALRISTRAWRPSARR